jgi:hypothetical protein
MAEMSAADLDKMNADRVSLSPDADTPMKYRELEGGAMNTSGPRGRSPSV